MIPVRDDYKPKRFPAATASCVALLAAVLLFFPLVLRKSGVYYYNLLALFPARFFHHASLSDPVELLTPLFSATMHLTWWHLFANCYLLCLFMPRVEDAIGRLPAAALLLLGGAAANLCQALANPESAARIVGASGGVGAIMAFYAFSFPKANLVYAVPPVKNVVAPAALLLGACIGLSLAGAVLSPDAGVSHAAHAAGLSIGSALGAWHKRRRERAEKPDPGATAG